MITDTIFLPIRQTMTRLAFTTALALAFAAPALAAVEDEYTPGGSPILTTWYGSADPAALAADRAFIAGMRPHHAGALTMARDYLADPAASSPVLKNLAHAIVANQTFEIGMLDEVERNLNLPPRVINLGVVRFSIQPVATEGLAQRQRFLKTPIPGPLDALAEPGAPVTLRDVQFAKGMTLHHQAALEMAREYSANPNGRNTYLGLMNVDIITDQSREIALMRRAIAAYPGDVQAVVVDPSTIHGMEGMSHGGHAGHSGMSMAQTPAAQPGAQSAPHAHRAPRRASSAAADGHAAHAEHDAHAGHQGH